MSTKNFRRLFDLTSGRQNILPSNFQGFQRVPLVMLWHCFRRFSDRRDPPEPGAPENAWFGKREFCMWQCWDIYLDYLVFYTTVTLSYFHVYSLIFRAFTLRGNNQCICHRLHDIVCFLKTVWFIENIDDSHNFGWQLKSFLTKSWSTSCHAKWLNYWHASNLM